jgi:hypothetical protein
MYGREELYTLGFGRHAFGSRKRSCEDNIKVDLKEIRWEKGVDPHDSG